MFKVKRDADFFSSESVNMGLSTVFEGFHRTRYESLSDITRHRLHRLSSALNRSMHRILLH